MAVRHCEITALYLTEDNRLERQVRDIVHEVFLHITALDVALKAADAGSGDRGRPRRALRHALHHPRPDGGEGSITPGLFARVAGFLAWLVDYWPAIRDPATTPRSGR